jgi:glutathione S-transferase
MLTIIYSPGSCAMASQIAFEEAGMPYENKKILLRDNDHNKPEFLAVNPKGKVPALITDRGILTETPAILAFIAMSNPKAKLAPLDDPYEFAQVQAFNAFLCATVHVNFAHRTRGYRWADEETSHADMTRKAPQNVRESFKMIDDGMIRGPFVMGKDYSIADMYLFTLSRWLGAQNIPTSEFPKIDGVIKAMADRPAVKKVVALHMAG